MGRRGWTHDSKSWGWAAAERGGRSVRGRSRGGVGRKGEVAAGARGNFLRKGLVSPEKGTAARSRPRTICSDSGNAPFLKLLRFLVFRFGVFVVVHLGAQGSPPRWPARRTRVPAVLLPLPPRGAQHSNRTRARAACRDVSRGAGAPDREAERGSHDTAGALAVLGPGRRILRHPVAALGIVVSGGGWQFRRWPAGVRLRAALLQKAIRMVIFAKGEEVVGSG